MSSPWLSPCRPWLLEPSYSRCGVGPLLRWGDWLTPDRHGVPTFRIGKMRWTSWPLDAGSGAPFQQDRSHLLTRAPARTSQPLSSPSSLRRFDEGFMCIQLGSNFSSHRFRLWLPTFFLHLLSA